MGEALRLLEGECFRLRKRYISKCEELGEGGVALVLLSRKLLTGFPGVWGWWAVRVGEEGLDSVGPHRP